MDHVDPNDPDPEAGRRTHTRLHHKVDLHLIQMVLALPLPVSCTLPFDKYVVSLAAIKLLYDAVVNSQFHWDQNGNSFSSLTKQKFKISYQVHFVNLLFQFILEPAIGVV